ncbi:MAG: hypothetical protein HQK53_16290 [Oligoflexia bacterium]|nr:hypothetical protein [Oligoflexia bacterium]
MKFSFCKSLSMLAILLILVSCEGGKGDSKADSSNGKSSGEGHSSEDKGNNNLPTKSLSCYYSKEVLTAIKTIDDVCVEANDEASAERLNKDCEKEKGKLSSTYCDKSKFSNHIVFENISEDGFHTKYTKYTTNPDDSSILENTPDHQGSTIIEREDLAASNTIPMLGVHAEDILKANFKTPSFNTSANSVISFQAKGLKVNFNSKTAEKITLRWDKVGNIFVNEHPVGNMNDDLAIIINAINNDSTGYFTTTVSAAFEKIDSEQAGLFVK